MIDRGVITEEAFDSLLAWLDENREFAAVKYEQIRNRLIRIFVGRGCSEAEALADETIDRVTTVLPRVAPSYMGEPALYFYGVANNVHHEWLRRESKLGSCLSRAIEADSVIEADKNNREETLVCLEKCLAKLDQANRSLILGYYKGEKGAKIENRRKLAEERGIGTNALHIKVSRIRSTLKDCIQNCLRGV